MWVRPAYVLLVESEIEGVFEQPDDAARHAIRRWVEGTNLLGEKSESMGVKQADGYRHGGERFTIKIIEQR